MRFLNWGKNKSARRVFRTDNEPERRYQRAELRRRSGLFSFSSLRRWFFGDQSEPGFAVYHVPIEPRVIVPPAKVPASYFRMVRVAGRGRLRVPREAATVGANIAYPLRGRHRGFGDGTIVTISKKYAQIFVERPDGEGFLVRHRIV